jgi:hypothetical protein
VLLEASSRVAVAVQDEPEVTVEQPVTTILDAEPEVTVKPSAFEVKEPLVAWKVPEPAVAPVRVTFAIPEVKWLVPAYPVRAPGPDTAAKATEVLELTVFPAASSRVAVATQVELRATVEQPVTAT